MCPPAPLDRHVRPGRCDHAADKVAAKDHLAHQHDDAAVARAEAQLARGDTPGLEYDWPEDGIA